MLKMGTGLDARYLPSPRPWKERVNTNGKSERTRDGRGTPFSVHLTRSSPRSFSSVHTVPGNLFLAFRLLHHPRQDAMCFCSLTARLAGPWLANITDTSSSHQQPSYQQQQQHPPLMHGAFVARTMQHAVSTMAQISVFDVATAGTVLPSRSGMQHRRTADGGWTWTRTRARTNRR